MILRTDEGEDYVEATFDAKLTTQSIDFAVSANASERARAAIALPTTTILLTDERFINLATGVSAAWTTALGAGEARAFKDGRVLGVTALGGRVLVAWGEQSTLGRFVADTAGHVVGHAADDGFFGELGAETASALPTFDGPVQLKIPPGTQSGRKLRLRGKGVPHLRGGGRGDLYVEANVEVPTSPEAVEDARKLDRFYSGDVRAGLRL